MPTEIYRPDLSKIDPDKDGLPGLSSAEIVSHFNLDNRGKEIVKGLLIAADEAKAKAAKLKQEFGESNADVIYWQIYSLILQHAARLKLLTPGIKHQWLRLAVEAFVAIVEWQRKRIKMT